jgi:PAS domain S-box-containing protein
MAVLLCTVVAGAHAVGPEVTIGESRVLYISSYAPGYSWNDELTNGIAARLAEEGGSVQLSVEHMDTRTASDDTHYANLRALYAHKYAAHQPDVIIVSDDNALCFMLENGEDLFPGVPVVFTGINDPDLIGPEPRTGYTGTVERLPVRETIDAALVIDPSITAIYGITDTTPTGTAIRNQIDAALATYNGTVAVRYPAADIDTAEELVADVRTLSHNTIILITTYSLVDEGGRLYHVDLIAERLADESPVPIYSTASIFNGRGIVGGVQNNPYLLGMSAADTAVLILGGTSPASIPVEMNPPGDPVFDYEVLQRFGLEESGLPPGSTILNVPSTDVTFNRTTVIGIAATGSILIILLVILAVSHRRIRNIKNLLQKSEEQYRSVVESQTELITRFLPDLTIIFANDAYLQYYGLNKEAPSETTLRLRVHPEDEARVMEHFASLTPADPVATIEERVLMPDGEVRWQQWSDRAIFDDAGGVMEYQSVGIDITDRKVAEEKLRRSLAEKTVLLQEVHHRVKNNLAVISSMLEMQAMGLPESEASELREAEGRIISMAAVHESLYRSESLEEIDAQEHFTTLAAQIAGPFPRSDAVAIRVDAGGCRLPISVAMPCSLIVNEFITNAMKYAFAGRAKGTITIILSCDESEVYLTFADDGVGMPAGDPFRKEDSLGLRMVKNFVEYQLRGTISLGPPPGTRWQIRFPAQR